MIEYLQKYFKREGGDEMHSLDIRYGQNGSTLTHSHSTQYTFVLQSLTLWRELTSNMYILWKQSDADMLSPSNKYYLQNTGQGYNRVRDIVHCMSGSLTDVHW